MPTIRLSGTAALLALAGLLPIAPATVAQESASIQSQCRREAQDYGIEPEQIEEYVSGCVLAYGGVPEAPAETPQETDAAPADAGAGALGADEQDLNYPDDQDTGNPVE